MSVSTSLESYAAEQEGAPRWFLGSLAWVKATGEQTGGRLSLVEHVLPAGAASPWHVHHTEDESFYVIEGQLTVALGDRRLSLGRGGFAFGPRDVPHGFRVEGQQPAHILLMTNSADFANFILEASEPAAGPTLPEPSMPDLQRLAALASKYGTELLGPFPE
jgi:quercetin dioxygenase-like cupin family protein